METTRDLGDTIKENYGGVLNFCLRYKYDAADVRSLIGADRVKNKGEIIKNAQEKDPLKVTDMERMDWLRIIESLGGFGLVANAIGEQSHSLRQMIFSKKFKDDRLENTLKEIYDLPL